MSHAAGYRPGGSDGSFGIEKRARGHLFQFNVSNGLGTTASNNVREGTFRATELSKLTSQEPGIPSSA